MRSAAEFVDAGLQRGTSASLGSGQGARARLRRVLCELDDRLDHRLEGCVCPKFTAASMMSSGSSLALLLSTISTPSAVPAIDQIQGRIFHLRDGRVEDVVRRSRSRCARRRRGRKTECRRL